MDKDNEGIVTNISLSSIIKEMCGSCAAKINSRLMLYALIIIALGNTYKDLIESVVKKFLSIP